MDTSIPWIHDTIELIKHIPHPSIPLKFHMIWVGENPIPEYAMTNFVGWKTMMPHWEARLWTNEDITTKDFPQDIVDKINLATKGAQKADIMRYYIVEKYGGFYIDTDTVPLRSLDPLIYMGYDLVLYHDNDLTWNYICNSPFGASPHHLAVQEVCKRVMTVEVNTNDVHMKTGPLLWGTTVSEVSPETGKRYCLLNHTFFSKFLNTSDKFGIHTYAATWVNN